MSQQTSAEVALDAEVETHRLRKFAAAIAAVDDTCRLQVDADGLSVAVVDAANVLCAEVGLPASEFERFGLDVEGVVGLDAEGLLSVCAVTDRETVPLEIDGGAVRVGFDELVAVNPEPLRRPPDSLEEIPGGQTASLTITGVQFRRVVREFRENEGALSIKFRTYRPPSDPPAIQVGAHRNGGLEHVATETFDAERAKRLDVGDEPADSLYSLEYVSDIAGRMVGSPPVTCRFGSEWPLSVSYPLAGAWEDDDRGRVTYHLAPRVTGGDGS